MGLTMITPPAEEHEPVGIDLLKAWLRVDGSDEDPLLDALTRAAREYIETALGRQLAEATYELTLPAFPEGPILLPRPPLIAVNEIRYRDRGGAVAVIDAGEYLVDTTTHPGKIELTTGWPETGNFPDAVAVEFRAGYGDHTDVPDKIKVAIQALAAAWFEQRGEGDVPAHVGRLINQCRIWAAA